MSTDADDEYLDDPISLLTIEDIKTEIIDEDQIIDVSSDTSDEEDTCTSAYGKKNFVLPVTFFDISRNVKLLNKCRPLSIKIVDCKQHPTYYTKEQNPCGNSPDESCVGIENKCDSNSETNVHNVNAEPIEGVGEKLMNEGEKKRKRSDAFYENLKKRKEERKRIALKCKDLSQLDFKRNTGLVGLKITDNIFKLIVNTEKAKINAKCNAVENKPQDKSQNDAEKPSITSKIISPDSKCKGHHDSIVEKTLPVGKCISIEKKCEDNHKKDNRDSQKKQTTSNDNYNLQLAHATENLPTNQRTYEENKWHDKNEKDIQKTNLISKALNNDKNKSKEKIETTADKEININTKSIDKCKDKIDATIRNQHNSKGGKSKEKLFESSKYMKKIGTALDNLGTSIIPLANDRSSLNNSEVKSPTAGVSQISNEAVKNKLHNNSETRCSLKILSNTIIEKALKLKKTNPGDKDAAHIQQNPKKAYPKVNEIASNLDLQHNNIEVSDKVKEPIKSTSTEQVDTKAMKHVDKVVVQDASRDPAGPNSPVIPCTTITFRTAPLKPNQTKTKPNENSVSSTPHTDTEVSSLRNMVESLPQISTTNESNVTISRYSSSSMSNEPAVSQGNINSTMASTHNASSIKTLRITEFKKISSDPRAVLSSLDYNVTAMNKRALSNPNVPNPYQYPTKGADMINAVKPPTPIENNMTVTNLMINNQTNPNQKTSMPPSSQIPSKFSGHNAIILRRPPLPPSRCPQNNPTQNQGKPIQTVVNNRFQYQPMLPGPRPLRFHYPPPIPPPPPPPTPPNNHPSFPQMRHSAQRFVLPNRMPPTHLRGTEMGSKQWRYCNPPLPLVYRPPLSVPRPPSPQVNQDSFIGNTANGAPIKKINIPMLTQTVDDKHKMLTELNNAMMSPELTKDQVDDPPRNLKRKADVLTDSVNPKYSKPGPLSMKTNTTTDSGNVKIPDKLSPNTGYSPPILPIFTYQESLKIFSPSDGKNSRKCAPTDSHHRTPLKRTISTANIRKLDNNNKRISHQDSEKQDKAKKISFEDYRKRVTKEDVDKIDVFKVRKYKEFKNADDYNQDQGYDSDSTVKL
ncbi:myb-like protein U [Leguminivora glycinivorella]|uniref:myb-like protein U n=1 Tax=Leguminivora glycinivorella TaxID=1035111 RepID=UPI00200C6614|nr:myb-like protein U [Leguminivora glycinivorella]XP_047996333.1 myb-like protein U [Leguminivora glycinivorella]